MVDTLEYLRRGGRIGAARGVDRRDAEGQADPHDRGRDAARRARADRAAARSSGSSPTSSSAARTAATRSPSSTSRRAAEAERLAERGREIYGRDPELISEIGPVIGTHTGPGILGVTGLRTDLLGPF